ncbi:MAG TPA: MFS transporter [Xanthobacteraceae bacterium]|nr:MFS transporter [Xanthobacteraceae bacterium]
MTEAIITRPKTSDAAFAVLAAVTFCHFLNDLATSLLPAIYPILKSGLDLSFGQIGFLTFVYQGVASMFQPAVGLLTDRRPMPYSLSFGMGCTLFGLATVAFAPAFHVLVLGAAMLGIGSAIFHPESSRLARLASGGAHGFAQSFFQVGGNFGNAFGPLAAAFFIVPHGQESLAWFAFAALLGMIVLGAVGRWYSNSGHTQRTPRKTAATVDTLPAGTVRRAIAVLIALIFSKYFYLAGITSYYIFYLIHRFGLTTEKAQLCLFVFLAASAAGTFIGGPVGDRIGRKKVIWGSILGVLPFTLVLPHVGFTATVALSVIIGLVISSAFSAILVYAQELMPGRIGMVSGLFFGLAFGMAAVGAAVLGVLIDLTSIDFVYRVCSVLPAIGMLAVFLPDTSRRAGVGRKTA